MLKYLNLFILLFSGFKSIRSSEFTTQVTTLKTFVFWPNASVPFYVDPDHFDNEQVTTILKSLAMFAFKTCIKFAPVMTAPSVGQHVMTFVNPDGVRRCRIQTKGHSNFDPHIVKLGYECLHTAQLEMIIARALGLPFEHNRMNRDVYIDVLIENIEPDYMQLFTKESILPPTLRAMPYDQDSVMHFGERDYSKNGHRTIIFKNRSFRQNKIGLTATDIKKIDLIYGPECRTRDRAEKIAMCQSYPGVSRRKREIIEPPANMSLRVNPNITPPPHIVAGIAEDAYVEKPLEILQNTEEAAGFDDSLNTLGIAKETDRIKELVYNLSVLALKNAREKYCNDTSNTTSEFEFNYENAENNTKSTDVLGIHKIIADFAKSIVDDAASNLAEFCQNSETVKAYQGKCKLENDARCPKTCRFSKSVVELSGKHKLVDKDPVSVDDKMKIGDEVPTTTLKPQRRKREANETVTTPKEEKNAMKKTEMGNEDKIENNVTEKVQAMKNERLNEIKKDDSTTKTEVVSSTDSQVKEDKKEPTRRKFGGKRYKVQKSQDTSDWEESDTSLDKKIEPEKTLSNKELLKKVLNLGASSVFETKKTKKKSLEVKSIEKEEKPVASSTESEKTSEENETTEEEGHTTVTKTKKEYKKAEESSSREEEEPEETEEKPKKRINYKSKRNQKHRKVPKTVELSKLNKEFYAERKWPDGVVMYVVAELPDYDLDDLRKRLGAVNSILTENTCVKLREVDAKEAPGFDNYLILDNSPDYVTGKVGGKQNFGTIELFQGGHHKQHTAMMVMAMLGFYFEVSRHDRDKYIRVHNRHIRADKLHHFEKIRDEATLDLPYDFKSATHPAWQFWRRVGKKGISTVATYKEQDPDGEIMRGLGQNPELLSSTDIIKINSVYGVECFQSNRASHKNDLRMPEKDDDVIQ